MHGKIRLISLLLLVLFSGISCWESKPSLEEQNAIKALTTIQNGIDANISLEAYLGLVSSAKADVDILKRAPEKNSCVMSAVERSYAAYEIVGRAWQKKINAKDEKRKQDLNTTMAFTLSFALLNIEKANKCYNK